MKAEPGIVAASVKKPAPPVEILLRLGAYVGLTPAVPLSGLPPVPGYVLGELVGVVTLAPT